MKKLNPDSYIKQTLNGFEVRVTSDIQGYYFERRKRGIESKGEARNIAVQFLEERRKFREQVRAGFVSWENAITEWEKFVRQREYSESTIYSAKLILNKHTARWLKRPIDTITTIEIEDLIASAFSDSQVDSKKGLLKHIRSVFRRQVQIGKLKENPANGIIYGKPPQKDMVAMTREEIIKLLTLAKEQGHEWYPVWRVVYELGLRSGEAYALKWEDIDFTSGFVLLKRSYDFKLNQTKSTKNNRFRSIPLNDGLKSFLLSLKTQSTSEFVFPRNRMWEHGEAAKVLRAFQISIGIRETNFHSLRASFITHLLIKGVSMPQVQQMVGHKRLETTQDYVRLVAADTKGATDALALNDD